MDTRERYQKVVEGLSQAIFHLTWLGEFWGFRSAILLDEVRSWYLIHKLGGNKTSTLSARSSTYYAAAGNARARAIKSFWLKPWWLMLAFLCFRRSMWLSNRLKELVGIQEMNPDQLDVRSHILRRAGRHQEALKCVDEARSRPNVSTNSQALLLMGWAESMVKLGASSIASIEFTYKEALSLKNQVPVSTQVRLLRSLAVYRRARGLKTEARDLFEQAKSLATREALADQARKIEVALFLRKSYNGVINRFGVDFG